MGYYQVSRPVARRILLFNMSKIRVQDDSGDKKYFTIIPNYILNHSTLWDREVYIQMKRITGEDGTCWTSQNKLSNQCGISVNRLKTSLKYLLDNGWIQQIGKKKIQTKGGEQEVNEYKVSDLWKMNVDYYENQKGVSPDDIPISKGVSPKGQRGITGEAKGVSPEGYKEEPLLRRSLEEEGSMSAIADAFTQFWDKYPKKELKKKSKDIWERKKPPLKEIIEFIEKAKKTDRWQKGYIKSPPAFLNGECWTDDLAAYNDQSVSAGFKDYSKKNG